MFVCNVLMCVVGMLWQDALLDAAVQEAANNKKKCDADHEPEAETEHDEEGGEDGEEEDVELDEPVPEEGS